MMNAAEILLDTLHAEVKPAMGCTEPVAVALAVAKAKELCIGDTNADLMKSMVDVKVSPNIFKNGLSVGIPGTDQVGLLMAIALGITACESVYGLEVFKSVNAAAIESAFQLLKNGQIKIGIADTDSKVYVEATVANGTAYGKAIIENRHDQFVHLEQNGEVMLSAVNSNDHNAPVNVNPLYDMKISEIIDAVEKLPYSEIEFLLEGYEMNTKVATFGLTQPAGMNVGKTLQNNVEKGLLTDDLMNRAMILTAAASDARMSGASLPVMSSNGSGNNGLTALLPLVAYAQKVDCSKDALARAAAISHLVNSMIKHNIGRLSALCGCGVAAGTGASVAITWLMGGTPIQLDGAIQNMIANTTGMICDGAKVGCSLKLATSASAAVQSALLAIGDVVVPNGNGVIGKTADDTIKNLGVLSKNAMDTVDRVILEIMMDQV